MPYLGMVAMKWQRKSAQSIKSGDWVVSRTVHSGIEQYTLWQGTEFVGVFKSAESAKRAAREKRQ